MDWQTVNFPLLRIGASKLQIVDDLPYEGKGNFLPKLTRKLVKSVTSDQFYFIFE